MAALTRRRLVSSSLAIGLLGLLPESGSADEASPTAGFPRTIRHNAGETTIPSKPARIVAVTDFIDLDYLLTLAIEPVLYGFSNAWESGVMPWQTAAADLPSFDATASTPDLEAIAAAQPDLIVSMPSNENGYALLSAIAPTIEFGWDTEWRSGLRLIGSALGLEARADERIADADAVIAAAKETLAPIAGKRLMVGFTYGDVFYIWGDQTPSALLFKELGLNFVGGPEPFLTSASLEQVNLLQDAEIVLSVASDPAGLAAQEASPLFRTLPAVQNGGYGVLSVIESRALGDSLSPISIPWVMPQFIELMQNLANGEGKQLT